MIGDPVLVVGAVVGDASFAALVAIVPTIILGILGLRSAAKKDKAAVASAAVGLHHGEAALAIDGLTSLLERTQAENAELRAENARLKAA